MMSEKCKDADDCELYASECCRPHELTPDCFVEQPEPEPQPVDLDAAKQWGDNMGILSGASAIIYQLIGEIERLRDTRDDRRKHWRDKYRNAKASSAAAFADGQASCERAIPDDLWSRVCEIAFSHLWSNGAALRVVIERGLGGNAEIERLRRELGNARTVAGLQRDLRETFEAQPERLRQLRKAYNNLIDEMAAVIGERDELRKHWKESLDISGDLAQEVVSLVLECNELRERLRVVHGLFCAGDTPDDEGDLLVEVAK